MPNKKPLVIYTGQYAQIQAGDVVDAPINGSIQLGLTNGESVAVVAGAPVYVSSPGSFMRACANAAATTKSIGLVATASIAPAGSGDVALDGALVLTTAQWDAVTGQVGGLIAGSRYFLDASAPGRLTPDAPSSEGDYIALIGTAVDVATMSISISTQPILL